MRLRGKITEAVKCLQKSLSTFADEGRFAMSAKTEKEVAELYEHEGMLQEAMEHFQKAADYYEGENQPAYVTF
jgi:alpha-soluble NSF attachment protein